MTANLARIRLCLQQFHFRTLFLQELGWDRPAGGLTVVVDGRTFGLQAVAEKRGFQVFAYTADDDGGLPEYATRCKIERQAAKLAHEHLIVYTDAARTTQKWQWVRRELGRPLARREYDFAKGRTGEALAQKLQDLAVDLAEEENLTLTDVTRRARQALDVDRVTRRFYDRFQTEHAAFLTFLKGVPADGDAAWYASLMLNRLMFIYFIQKKGFLDGDPDYLRNRLRRVGALKGKDKFLTFYRYFLLRLFHEGLGQQPRQRKKDLDELLGRVPYLNGGLFDEHQLERTYPEIQIADAAFARLFDFFDAFRWHLDERPLRADNEINPDVLGYIFEKYINQKQMGAYYTKEDITGYIARNTILPFLFNAAEMQCAIAFQSGSALWRLLADDPDRYIHDAVRKGVDLPLPPAVEAGNPRARSAKQGRDVSPLLGAAGSSAAGSQERRGGLNTPATPEYGLPTETWREFVARRQRCHELRAKLKAGEIHDVNDLITHNLDIFQFAEDAIENCEGPELLRAVYQALERATVLDPTCGSGAFLFAALNILEPLYEACLDRMAGFLEDMRRLGGARRLDQFGDFHQVLNEAARHPNRRYFILKSIIVNNLYGVDVMEEAVEICKLRLFLKLVAQVESAEQIEPLPDIDFNVRAGNTLVGFASLTELEALQKSRLGFDAEEVTAILDRAKEAEKAFAAFRRLQVQFGAAAIDYSEAKKGLQAKLAALREKLDRYLAGEYGVDADKPDEFGAWRESHRPFHWLAEFYGIMSDGGFDVIIGNPPWKEYAAVKKEYTVRGYATEPCGNLHCLCTERSLRIRHPLGRMSFIVQLPMVSSSRMAAIRSLLAESSAALHVITFDDRPGKLFDGLQHCRSVIFLSQSPAPSTTPTLLTTRYQRWATEVRENLFEQVEYACLVGRPLFAGLFPKYAGEIQESLFRRVGEKGAPRIAEFQSKRETGDFVFYQEATQYWVKATYGLPYYAKNSQVGAPAHGRYLFFARPETAHAACAVLNSSLFYAYFIAYGDCFHLSDGLATGFPVSEAILADKALVALNKKLMDELRDKAVRKTINTRDGDRITYDEFYGGRSKPIIDEIDAVLAKHYGFTAEELDFILNYDIKYRMGQDGGDGDDE